MRRSVPILALALLATPASAQLPDAWWQRAWTVEEIRCARCDAPALYRLREAVGQTITILPDRFDNPLYESCNGRPDYDQVARRPRAEAEQAFRRLWPTPRIAATMPVAGMVRCHATGRDWPNSLGYFVFDNAQRGYYRWEGGAVAVLR
jgi:hypothetical protein